MSAGGLLDAALFVGWSGRAHAAGLAGPLQARSCQMSALLGTDGSVDCRGLLCKYWGCAVSFARSWELPAAVSLAGTGWLPCTAAALLAEVSNRPDLPLLLAQRISERSILEPLILQGMGPPPLYVC